MSQLVLLGYIALGGAIGACTRYALSEVALNVLGKSFPFGTLLVNVLGSFIMGLVLAAVKQEILIDPWRQFIGIGFLGALTTFSTFSADNLLLLQSGEWIKLGLNISLNVFLCLLVTAFGMHILKYQL